MNSYEIIYRLKRRGISVKGIASNLGVSGPAVSQVIHQKYQSRRVSQTIADALELPLEEVFPKYRQDKEAA